MHWPWIPVRGAVCSQNGDDRRSYRPTFYARWASFFVAISFCSNFSFAYADAVIMATFFVWTWTTPARSQLGFLRLTESCFLPGVLTAVAICGPTVWDF